MCVSVVYVCVMCVCVCVCVCECGVWLCVCVWCVCVVCVCVCVKLHNKGLNDLYSSPNIVQVIKSKRMRWVGHVTRVEKRRGVYMGFGGET